MIPLLRADEEVLVDPAAYRLQSPRIGDIVVAWHPTRSDLRVIKRIVQVDEDDRCSLRGDNPDPARNSSVVVSAASIQGRVTSRFATPG